MFIQTEVTTDPARLKFLPGCEVLLHGALDLNDKTQAAALPLAERLFAIPEVAGVSLGRDSVTVTKAGGDWQHHKPVILGAIMEHFRSGPRWSARRTSQAPGGQREAGKPIRSIKSERRCAR